MINIKKFSAYIFGLVIIILLSSCATTLPPITKRPTNMYDGGRFVWHDLITNDVETVKEFYADIFAWEYEEYSSGYTIIKHHGALVGGILYSDRVKEDISETRWMPYLSVPDVDIAASFFVGQGGELIREPWDLEDRGRLAVVADPQGAIFVILKATGGDPQDIKPRLGQWLWTELITTDTDSAVSFYEQLMGYTSEIQQLTKGYNYYFLKSKDKYRAGIVKSPWENVKPNWLPYIKVEDPKFVVDRVKKLGGEIILAPDQKIRKGSVAIIADPTGGVLAVQKWPIE